ncbi:putative cytochrome B pre-mRNA-processing protein [Clavispora lusitaniae]|uniref:DASH complex subunit DUO1 n=3 Tax=Clavispora lusitaniae TaxID=36911 RepID=C4Y4H1_CLAL4|nr:uncharacterized protein CLUG_02543 [Clavispora lusitaniae ATCC 42720]KAF5211355.1 hypothetical protein E0198_002661 [Clavispora lusitaniae]EEQ38417.1 hypothetical protein CLUG_02543 [Clavispora lusitaniae ATCC 42720]KAF7580187.1 DASH complex subunit Duo1 family protein [Clavispora lusitaniae]OVF08842.1 hypothetical protein A9F13_07g03289 [Clavispora lusitaniae]QFZ27749.1 putative cytochrome B pre-mRNA-processing protein [Clavispora lusitaniae]
MSRQQTLERELEQVTNLNKTVDSLLETIRTTQQNIATTKSATDSTSALLEDWIRILNQTSFANNALQNPLWEGSKDEDIEEENLYVLQREKQLEAELKVLEQENQKLEARLSTLNNEQSTRETKRSRR